MQVLWWHAMTMMQILNCFDANNAMTKCHDANEMLMPGYANDMMQMIWCKCYDANAMMQMPWYKCYHANDIT